MSRETCPSMAVVHHGALLAGCSSWRQLQQRRGQSRRWCIACLIPSRSNRRRAVRRREILGVPRDFVVWTACRWVVQYKDKSMKMPRKDDHNDKSKGKRPLETALSTLKSKMLFWAVRKRDLRTIRSLLARGANADWRDPGGRTPLLFAASNGYLNEVKELLDHGASPNMGNEDGWTPLHRATERKYFKVLQELLSHGAAMDAADHVRQPQIEEA
ncbi:hypothetical protein AC1031_013127 [Aphanomyces cochlioides]|nr:hypothetical protein AC1031_013127 [Aphanomyces cochlioides]